jgi:putative FmdB family regulatory protein
MPTYEYRCETCGGSFERHESIRENEIAEVRCPECGSENVARVFSAFFAKTSRKS